MTSKPRKAIIDSVSMSDERSTRGSVFDRLGAKQTMSHQQSYHQIRSSSTKMQPSSSKYEMMNSDPRSKLDSVHSSHSRHFHNQYGQEPNPHYQSQDVYYNKSNRNSAGKQMIKSKINKPDDYHDQYKK